MESRVPGGGDTSVTWFPCPEPSNRSPTRNDRPKVTARSRNYFRACARSWASIAKICSYRLRRWA